MWAAYVKSFSDGQPLKAASFRDKTFGWHYFSMRLQTAKKKYVRRLDEDTYTQMFLENVTLRPSCYACKFKRAQRIADFTLADCWGAEKLGLALKDDDKGLSLLFVNTEKGKQLIHEMKPELELERLDLEKATRSQGAMTSSVPYNPQREVFFANADAWGMEQTIERWYGWDAVKRAKRKYVFVKTMLRKIMK